mgnify:CR=1 FL=1
MYRITSLLNFHCTISRGIIRRAEAQRYERRVQQKEESIDKKAESIEKKEVSLTAREEELAKQRAIVAKIGMYRITSLLNFHCTISRGII